MTTYIQKKERVFRERGDTQSERSRNVGEMKRIGSCIDRRAWATSDEERRQHILEYQKAKAAFGTYVPVDVLIDLVCATKNAEIEALSKRIEELEKLLEMYNELDLTDEQRRKLQQMTAQIQGAADADDSLLDGDLDNSESTTYGVCAGETQTTQGCTDDTCTQTAANIEDVGAINIDFNIDGSAELEIDVEPVCEPDCGALISSEGGGGGRADVGGANVDGANVDGVSATGGSSDLQSLLAQRDREIAQLREEINRLKSQLSGAQQTDLKKKLTHSQLALASAQQEKAQLAKAITSSKAPELLQLEEEIACLRSNPNLTPEQETEVIKKELDVLKRYCDQLSNIQEENDQLKLENDYFKSQFGDGGDIQALKQRAAMVDHMTCERDSLRNEVERLAGGMEILRKKSDAAEQLEREKCQLQKELNDLGRERRKSDYNLELARSENEDCLKSLEITRCERDSLRERVVANECAYNELQRQTMQLQCAQQNAEQSCRSLQEELCRMRTKAKESDVYRLERDRLQLRVEELGTLEVEVLTLVEKVKNLSIERDVLKRQGCDLHNIIADQEHEIKALLLHVDRLSHSVEKQQDKIRTALDELQCELEHKNSLLASSQEQLQNESQQRLCLAQLENDLRKTIVDLKNELNDKEAKIRSLERKAQSSKCAAFDDDIDAIEEENRKLRERIEQLECVCAHRHVDEILESSKEAVGFVIDEFKSQRSQTPSSDYVLEENKQLRKNSKDIQNLATERIDQLSYQLEQAIKENEELRAENVNLKSMTKGIETDLKIYNSQLEEPIPSSESDSQVMEELKKCRIANANLEAKLKSLQESGGIRMESTCTCNELKKELERCRETGAQLDMTMSNLNRVPSAEESKSIKDLQMKLELCRDANMQLESTIRSLRDQADTRVNSSDGVVITVEEQLEVEMSVRKQFQRENCDLRAKLQEQDELIRNLQQGQGQDQAAAIQTLYKTTNEFPSEMPLSREEQDLQALLNTLQEENKKLQSTIEVKDVLITKMQADMQSSMGQGSKEENKSLLIEIDQLKDIIQTMEKLRQPVEDPTDFKTEHTCPASIDYILAENEYLKARIDALQNQICDLKLQSVKKPTATATTSCVPKSENRSTPAPAPAPAQTSGSVCSLMVCALKTEIRRLQDELKAKSGGPGCTCTILKKENAKLQEELNNFRKSVTKYIPPSEQRSGGYSPISPVSSPRSRKQSLRSYSSGSPTRSESKTDQQQSDTYQSSGRSFDSSSGSRTNQQQSDTPQSTAPRSASCSAGKPIRSGSAGRSDSCPADSPRRSGSAGRSNSYPADSPTRSGSAGRIDSYPADSPTRSRSPLRSDQQFSGSMQLQVHSPNAASFALSPARRTSTPRSLPPATNEQLLIENLNLQAQMADLKDELNKFSCLLSGCGEDNEIDRLREINEDLSVQVQNLKDEIAKLSSIRLGATRSSRSIGRSCSSEQQNQVCSRVQLLQEEIQRLKEYQEGDTSEVEHLKKILVQQEYDVDRLRNENIRLQRALQECESMICLPAEEQVSISMYSMKREITELKCENDCLRACLKSTSPGEESSAISKLGSYTSNKDLRDEIQRLKCELESERNFSAANNNTKELEQLRSQLSVLKKCYEDLVNVNSNLCQEMCKTKNEQMCMKNQIDELNRKLSELERDRCQLQGQLDATEKSMNKRLADITKELEDKIRQLEEEKLRMKREQRELMERLEQSVNHCSAQESELEMEIQRLKNRITQLEKLNCSLESDFADCKDELERVAKNQIRELEAKLKQAEDDRAHLEARLCKMTYEQDVLSKKLEDKIREANEREIALDSELMKLRGQVKSLEDENMDLERKLAEAQYALEKLEEEIKEKMSELEQHLAKLVADNKRLVQEKEKAECENNYLKSKVNELELNCNELENLSASKEQVRTMETQLANCMEENSRLLAEIEKLKKEKTDLKNEIADLLDKLQICEVNLTDSKDKEQLEELVKRMELQLKHCDVQCKDTRQLDLELKRLLEENERLKKQCEEEKMALEAQFENSLALLKEQYDRDVEFVRGRHSEGIVRLQDMHEDTVSGTIKEYEREIENLQRQLAELMKQKQLDDETIKKQLEEIEKLTKLAQVEVDACRSECKELRGAAQEKMRKCEEENTRLKAELEIAKKCCEELDKLKQKLEDDKNKMKTSLDDVTRTSMVEVIKMRDSVDSILQKNEAEMAKMKDYLKSLEAELDKARKDLENERNRLNDEINRLKAELDKAKKCCEDLERLTAQLESSGKKSSFLQDQQQMEIDKLKDQLDLLNNELANEKKRLGAEIDRLKAELEMALKCCTELEAIKKNLNKDNSDLENELDEQRKKCLEELERLKKFHEMNDKKYEDLIAQLRAELAEYKKCCDELERVKKELDGYEKRLKGAGDAEQQSKQDLLNLQKELEKQKNQYELEIARLKRELEDKKRLEDEIARLKQELALKQKCCDDLENVKRQLEVCNANLANAYSKDTSKCEEELAKIKAELSSIRKQYDDEIAKLKKELENCKSLVNDLQKQKSDLEDANKSLKAQLDKANADHASQLAKLKAESEEAKKRLEEEIARLKKELAAKQKCCDDLEAVQRQLDMKNKELAAALSSGNKDCEEELAKLRKEMENLKKKYEDELSKLRSDLESERKRAEEAMAKLKKDLEDLKRKNDELENSKKNLEKQLTEARSKGNEGLDNCLEELAKLKKDLERNKKRYEDEIENLKRELAQKAKCCDELENMKKELDKANKALQASKDDAAKRSADEINSLKKELDETVKRYEDKLAKLRDEMAAQRKQYEDEISKLKAELNKYKKCCDELDELKLALQNEKMRLESEINKLKQDLQNEKDNRKRDIDELNKELEKAKQCCKDLEAAKKELEALRSQGGKDLEKLKKDLEDQLKRSANELAECRKKLEELKAYYEEEIERLKKELSIKEKCCQELDALKNSLLDDNIDIKKHFEDELKRLQAELDKAKKCCEDLEDAKKQLAKAKQDCEDELKKLKAEIEKLKGDIEKLKDEKDKLAARMKKLEEEKASLENDYNKLKTQMSDSEAGNKALQDCRDQLQEEKKRCEMEIAKLRAQLKELQDEINRLKEQVKKGEKCCEELEKQKKELKTEVDDFKDRRRNSRDSAIQQRAPTRDSQTQDIKRPTRDSTTLTIPTPPPPSPLPSLPSLPPSLPPPPEDDNKVKVCPCGAIAKERGIKLRSQAPVGFDSFGGRRKSSMRDNDTANKLNRLSKATALIVEVQQGDNMRPRKYALTKKSIIITNVEPSSSEVNRHLISLEEARPVNLTQSVESILSKALKVGLENLTHEELKGLHNKTKDAVSTYDPQVKKGDRTSVLLTESEIALSKLPLQRRISQLENELTTKQKYAQQKMHDLEHTILSERQQMMEMQNRSMSEQRKLGWENDSLKQQASFHEIRLQQLLAQIEQEKARSTSLKADLLKARAIEAQLVDMLEQNRVQGQCSYVEGKLHPNSCPKAKQMQRQSIENRKSIRDKDTPRRSSRKSLTEEPPDDDSSGSNGDEKTKRSNNKKKPKKK